jgi:hypothetical protein
MYIAQVTRECKRGFATKYYPGCNVTKRINMTAGTGQTGRKGQAKQGRQNRTDRQKRTGKTE